MNNDTTEARCCLVAVRDGLRMALENLERLAGNLKELEPAPPPTREFGEPWKGKSLETGGRGYGLVDSRGWIIARLVAGDEQQIDRAAACVNGNRDIRNPAAVPELIAYVRGISAACPTAAALLAALDEAPDAEGGA